MPHTSRRQFLTGGGAAMAAFALGDPLRQISDDTTVVLPQSQDTTRPLPLPALLVPTTAASIADNPRVLWEWKPWDAVRDQPADGAFRTIVDGRTFENPDDVQWNPTMRQGYNVDEGGWLQNPDEPGAWWGIDANYLSPSGTRWIGAYYEVRYGPERGESLRPLYFLYDRERQELSNTIFQTDFGLALTDSSDVTWGSVTPTRLTVRGIEGQEVDSEISVGSKNGRGAQLSISSDRHQSNFVLAPSGSGQWSTFIDGQTQMRMAPDSVVFGDTESFDGTVTSRVAPDRVDTHANFTAAVRDDQSTAAFQLKYGRTTWGTRIGPDGRLIVGVGDPGNRALVGDGTGYSDTPVIASTGDRSTGVAFPAAGEVSLYASGERVAHLSAKKPDLPANPTIQQLVDVLVQLDLVNLIPDELTVDDTIAETAEPVAPGRGPDGNGAPGRT